MVTVPLYLLTPWSVLNIKQNIKTNPNYDTTTTTKKKNDQQIKTPDPNQAMRPKTVANAYVVCERGSSDIAIAKEPSIFFPGSKCLRALLTQGNQLNH